MENFKSRKFFSMGYKSFSFSLVVANFNRDKKLDFAAANYGAENLKIMLKNC